MLAGNFYKMSKLGGKTVKKGTLDAPKLSAGGGGGGAGARGRGRGRGFAPPRPIVPAQNLRPIQVQIEMVVEGEVSHQ